MIINKYVIQEVCNKLKFDYEEIMSSSRRKDIVCKRNILIYLTRKLSRLTHKEIGEIFNKSRVAVIDSINTIEEKITKDKYFKEYLKMLLRMHEEE